MENIDEIMKNQIDALQNQIKELKIEFIGLNEIVKLLEIEKPDLDRLNDLQKIFSKQIFSIEELGKRSSALFVNKNLYNDSTELTKYFHQGKLKIDAMKEAFISKDRTAFYKHLSALNRSLDSAEYMLSLFIGELTSEITKVIFKQVIEKKSASGVHDDMTKLIESVERLNERVEKCEKKVSLMLKNDPQSFLDEDETKVLNGVMKIHEQNVQWVEPRFIEKRTPLPKNKIDDILDDFLRFGILEYKLRGGMKVYKYKCGENNDINKD